MWPLAAKMRNFFLDLRSTNGVVGNVDDRQYLFTCVMDEESLPPANNLMAVSSKLRILGNDQTIIS